MAAAEWLKIDRSLGVLAVDDDDADDGKKPDHCSSHNGLKSALKDLSCYHFNIVSGSDANITTPCEMEIFNFLWLIWDHYIPLAPT